MGFHVSWIASRGKPADMVRAELGLRETPDREELPESEITGVQLPSGWYVVFFNDLPPDLDDSALRRLSRNCELMAFVVDEASMVSLAHRYENGKRSWSVGHDSGKGSAHLDVIGDPPASLAAIRARLAAGFDVPAELSKELTGFRHDEDAGGQPGDAFTVLEKVGRWHTLLNKLGWGGSPGQ